MRRRKQAVVLVVPDDVVWVHEDEGIRTGLVARVGPKFVSVIWPASSGITIHRLLKDQVRLKVQDYPVKRARAILLRCGRSFGITKSARRILQVAS